MRTLLASLLLLPVLALAAATTQDLEGRWLVDADATWAMMEENPHLKAQFGAMPTEQQAAIRSMVMEKMAKVGWNLSAGRAAIIGPDGALRTSTWTVSQTEGETLSIEATDDQGHSTTGSVTIAGDRLFARGFANPTKGQGDTALVMTRDTAGGAEK